MLAPGLIPHSVAPKSSPKPGRLILRPVLGPESWRWVGYCADNISFFAVWGMEAWPCSREATNLACAATGRAGAVIGAVRAVVGVPSWSPLCLCCERFSFRPLLKQPCAAVRRALLPSDEGKLSPVPQGPHCPPLPRIHQGAECRRHRPQVHAARQPL